MLDGFSADTFSSEDVSIFYRVNGAGSPLLLVHGHPQTHVIWHKVADQLSEHFTVVLADLRGYGDSSRPASDEHHMPYSKRTMAQDLKNLMASLDFNEFQVLAHDRGARVAHRLAADHPNTVRRMMLLDIAPTLSMYEGTNETFARAYWHWFFLIRPHPLPELLIKADPDAYLNGIMAVRSEGMKHFTDAALAEYRRCIRIDGTAESICEDYRASATIDLVHDRADRDAGKKLAMPLEVLWGDSGAVGQCFDVLAEWQKVASNVRGEALPAGHYIPEEVPDLLLERALRFFN